MGTLPQHCININKVQQHAKYNITKDDEESDPFDE